MPLSGIVTGAFVQHRGPVPFNGETPQEMARRSSRLFRADAHDTAFVICAGMPVCARVSAARSTDILTRGRSRKLVRMWPRVECRRAVAIARLRRVAAGFRSQSSGLPYGRPLSRGTLNFLLRSDACSMSRRREHHAQSRAKPWSEREALPRNRPPAPNAPIVAERADEVVAR